MKRWMSPTKLRDRLHCQHLESMGVYKDLEAKRFPPIQWTGDLKRWRKGLPKINVPSRLVPLVPNNMLWDS